MLPKFKQVSFTDSALSRFQDNVANAFGALIVTNLLDGQLLTGIKLSAGVDNAVSHKLSRVCTNYIITSKNAASDIFTSATINNLSDKLLLLNCTSDVTVNIWVF